MLVLHAFRPGGCQSLEAAGGEDKGTEQHEAKWRKMDQGGETLITFCSEVKFV